MTKKILFISYHYPPELEVGAQRVAQFVKYFNKLDSEPYVLTIKEQFCCAIDTTQYDPSIYEQVTRTPVLPWFRDTYLKLTELFRKNNDHKTQVEKSSPRKENNQASFVKRLILSLLFYLPDDKVGWVLPAVYRGLQIVRKEEINTILTTGPPHSTHLVGYLIKKLTKKKWLLDLRDPWINTQKSLVRTQLSDSIEKWLERKMVTNCDLLICVTDEMTALYQDRYPNCDPSHFHTIPNGYDPDELKQLKKIEKYPITTFTYTGTLYLDRDPEIFLVAMSELVKESVLEKDEIAIRLIGKCRIFNDKSVEELAISLGLVDIVHFVDPVPREVALEEASKSHILILFAQNQPLQIPGKLYDYIGLGAYILGICENGASQRILTGYERAVIVERQTVQQMKRSIIEIINIAKSGKVSESLADKPFAEQYSRKELAIKLYDCI